MQSLNDVTAADQDQKKIMDVQVPDRLKFKLKETTRGLLRNKSLLWHQSTLSQYDISASSTGVIEVYISGGNNSTLLDIKNSYLMFKAAVKPNDAGGYVSLGGRSNRSGLTRLFNRIRVSTSSGQVQEIRGANLWYDIQQKHLLSDEFIKSSGQLWGSGKYNRARAATVFAGSPPSTAEIQSTANSYNIRTIDDQDVTIFNPLAMPATKMHDLVTRGYTDNAGAYNANYQKERASTFIIPLSFLSGFCAVNDYLPLSAMGQIKFEFFLDSATVAVHSISNAVTTDPYGAPANVANARAASNAVQYTLSDVYIVSSQLNMNDKLASGLQKVIENGKCQIAYDSVWYNQSIHTSNSIAFQVSKALFNVKSVHNVIRAVQQYNNGHMDSFDSVTDSAVSAPDDGKSINPVTLSDFKSFRVFIGSVGFPSARECTSLTHAYLLTQESFGRQLSQHFNACSYTDYLSRGCALFSVDTETDGSPFTGMSTSNGRMIDVNIQFNNPPVTALSCDTFVLYTAVLKIGPNQFLSVSE